MRKQKWSFGWQEEKTMNPKHMNFQKKTMLVLAGLLAVILIYVVAFALPVRRKLWPKWAAF